MGGRRYPIYHSVIDEDVWNNPFLKGLEDLAKIHMADQGDGNHFAYLGEIVASEELASTLWEAALVPGIRYRVLVTHHGSRGLGAKLYKRGLKTAIEQTKQIADDIPDLAAWISYDSQEGKDYWEALQYIERWTRANHESIHSLFLDKIRKFCHASVFNAHNFVWRRDDKFLHGKGATPSSAGEIGLIPLNMTEPILIVRGHGRNEDALQFAPHGAGRNLSRTKLIEKHAEDLDGAYEYGTRGVDVRWYSGKPDLSETAIAYKDAKAVKEQIIKYDLTEIIGEILPYGCIMSGEVEKPWLKKKIV
jgi:RNA-splicing ligase RtcB